MADAIRAYPWEKTDLGPIDGWPAALKTALGMALNSKFPKALTWGPDFITFHNDAFLPILGSKPPALGRSFRDVWKEAWEKIGPIADHAYAGEATFIEDFPLVVDRHGYPEQCYFTFCYSPIRDENGIVQGMMDTVVETTATVETQNQTRLLAGELEHRIKNTMAVVSAIISQSLTSVGLEGEAKTRLSHRIAALAEAQSLLTGSQVPKADIRAVIEKALLPFMTGRNRLELDGPPVELLSRQASMLALAINELATNAIKYGALSTENGTVSITWSAGCPATGEPFRLTWSESGGPPAAAPRRRGFGSRILEQALSREFQGNASLTYAITGLRYELTSEMRRLKNH